MHDIAATLDAWNSFYVMIGSSAAALTGLMFVVITLVNDGKGNVSAVGVSTFSTPSVVHFCCVLFTAGFMSAPFRSLVPIAVLGALAGAGGAFYIVRVASRSASLETYRFDAEDLAWHVLLPFAAYATLAAGAIALPAAGSRALYALAAAVTLLIFIGIHNAWDVVTYLTISDNQTPSDRGADAGGPG